MKKQNDKPINPRKGGKAKEKVANASRKSWEEVALLNALKEMVVGRGEKNGKDFFEKIGKDSFKGGYLKKLEGMLVLAFLLLKFVPILTFWSKMKVWKK